MRRYYYMEDGRLMVKERPGMLVKCQIAGCDKIMPEEELFTHEVGHPDPVEVEVRIPKPRMSSANEEGVYSVTSLSGE